MKLTKKQLVTKLKEIAKMVKRLNGSGISLVGAYEKSVHLDKGLQKAKGKGFTVEPRNCDEYPNKKSITIDGVEFYEIY